MLFRRKSVTCPISYQSIPLSTSIEDLTFVVFDTETTGFNVGADDRLIEIGAVTIRGLEVYEDECFQTYVNPQRNISQEIIDLTSITPEKVENAPEAIEAINEFFEFIKLREAVSLVGHYVSFDSLVLKNELKRANRSLKGMQAIDTLDLIGHIAPSYDMRDLERYSMAFGTRIYERHNALGDARTTAYLFTELLRLFKDRGGSTWGDLINVTNKNGG
ncbi:DNA polymerase-3 subunit epsilon [Mesobacillus persicus]|uniref:DNA polymerase-3 subunit epsilon n=1 Tax=Mesobacillus persicus TaxID=930146 RepID=A0A1H8H3T2_9BACI|nr:3'-5' exonuclease [Mesobacillus persicus]SEN50397.1 DNA polymerase-3 subunit epsilon [Mesobacillus persicus]